MRFDTIFTSAIALLSAQSFAHAEIATAPAVAPVLAEQGGATNLPKDDYGLVAWCHGALSGQLELDAVAHTDMESIEGKAKVAARAKSDAQMTKDRRQYLKDYEKALSAAETASPTAIHAYGVQSEKDGYMLWSVTRQKAPIWRMLDWGMWDANDAGCGEAAKRLYNKATLLGLALKSEDKAAPASPTEPDKPAADPIPTPPSPGETPGAQSDLGLRGPKR